MIMIRMKRPLSVIILLIMFIALLVYQALGRSGGVYYFYLAFISLLIINVSNLLINRNYIEIKENTVTIYRDLFLKTKLKLSDIDQVSLSYSPFAKSYFKLINGGKVRFSASNIDKDDLEKLKMITPNIH